jgi:hypothetical protein
VRTLARRLTLLEARDRPAAAVPAVRLFWHDELLPCPEHPRCGVEPATGLHHRDAVWLRFSGIGNE